jgi:hypothetical protein
MIVMPFSRGCQQDVQSNVEKRKRMVWDIFYPRVARMFPSAIDAVSGVHSAVVRSRIGRPGVVVSRLRTIRP